MKHSVMEWPTQSPELSIIETLWDRLEREHNQQENCLLGNKSWQICYYTF